MKFAQNNNPTFLFGINEYTRLFGTWEYGDEVTNIRKHYIIFVYILQGKTGKTEL